jgi:membrane protein DedA with SNARE-associated domain
MERTERAHIPRRRLLALLPVLGVALVLLVLAFLEGDLPEELTDLGAFVRTALARYGAPVSLGLLYIEESGVPLPVPGDVYVAYLGHLGAGSWLRLGASWLGIIAVVVAGATNLYLVSRRWGSRLLEHRLAALLRLDPARLARVEGWFARWGALAIIFGRHLPGFRIPITVMAGVFRVPYRVFAPSVAVSTGIWAGVWLLLGARFGSTVTSLFSTPRWTSIVVAAAIGLVLAYVLVRAFRRPGRA